MAYFIKDKDCLFNLAGQTSHMDSMADPFELTPFPPERKAIDIGDYYSDFSLITKELGWQPKVGLREGLQWTMAYYLSHNGHYWDEEV
jgi:dTDP-D-glucose 4,6-dehydratase